MGWFFVVLFLFLLVEGVGTFWLLGLGFGFGVMWWSRE